jgi:hypothetical protein
MGKKVVQLSSKKKLGGSKMDVLALGKTKILPMKECQVKEDEVIANLRAAGKVLNSYFNFSQDDINEAIKDARKEWK